MALKKARGSNKSMGICKLVIDEELSIYTIESLKEELSAVLDDYNNFELSLADIEEIDSAGIQLVLAFQKELKKQNKKFKLGSVSGVVTNKLTNLGLVSHFGLGAAT